MATRKVPEAGSKAPSFTLPDAKGKPHKLADYAGKTVVLYFYPKDDTPGCTTEACDFRDSMSGLAAHGVVVLGVSPDKPETHARFADKYGLPFSLLADTDRGVMEKYGAWGEKVLYGKKTTGVIRSTFVIDRKGKIAHVWPSVKAKGHVAQVMAKLQELDA